MAEDRILTRLKQELGSELAAVKPLASPWSRALFLGPNWVLLLAAVLLVFGIRNDYEQLGPLFAWVLAVVPLLAAYLLLWIAFRTVVPGLGTPIETGVWAALLATGTHLVVSAVTFNLSPQAASPGTEVKMVIACFSSITLLGLFPLLLCGFLISSGLPLRPRLTGILCGFGAGLAAEAAWRMHCSISSWEHILVSHSAAILLMTAVGALLAVYWQRKADLIRKEL